MTHAQEELAAALPRRHAVLRGLEEEGGHEREPLEWLVTNGIGGYASGTVTGHLTRRFHGLLISALPAPFGRVMMLPHVAERLRFADGTIAWMGAPGEPEPLRDSRRAAHLVDFRLDGGIPTWRYELHRCVIERTLVMPYGHNTVHLRYRVVSGTPPERLDLRPLVGVRPHEAPVDSVPLEGYSLVCTDKRIEVHNTRDLPVLRLVLHAPWGLFTVDNQAIPDVRYLLEEHRGYDHAGHLWTPGYFRTAIPHGETVTLIASTDPWDAVAELNPDDALEAELRRRRSLIEAAQPEAREGVAAELVLAADQFIIRPATRDLDRETSSGKAAEGERRTIVAGYHWFTDWGRDTMIALEGLTLITGRHVEARGILMEFARHVRNGLVPNFFPEGANEGVYHTADASLWFFHAVRRYELYTGDRATVDALLPVLLSIIEHHEQGTSFGIRMAEDGLLTQGEAGYQLTWMDAKAGDWVVTPRHGKAVEVNALWYNALALTRDWLAERGQEVRAASLDAQLSTTYRSFNERFWNPARRQLYDVVDGESGNDDACRPNQILSFALEHPVLDRERWDAVLEAVRRELLTPYGLRSLSPQHPDYKPRYFGDLLTRDAAYHQGTVWAWLIGPYVDAHLAARPDDVDGVRAVIAPLIEHLGDACLGSVSEIFDAEPPYVPRGCVAQAWSVAELLRVLARIAKAGRAPA
jgi:predicted glycogen debranching enzyme